MNCFLKSNIIFPKIIIIKFWCWNCFLLEFSVVAIGGPSFSDFWAIEKGKKQKNYLFVLSCFPILLQNLIGTQPQQETNKNNNCKS